MQNQPRSPKKWSDAYAIDIEEETGKFGILSRGNAKQTRAAIQGCPGSRPVLGECVGSNVDQGSSYVQLDQDATRSPIWKHLPVSTIPAVEDKIDVEVP